MTTPTLLTIPLTTLRTKNKNDPGDIPGVFFYYNN